MDETRKEYLKDVLRYARLHKHRETIEWLISQHGEENMGPAEADEILQELDHARDQGHIK